MCLSFQVLELHRNQNGIHLDLDEPHSDGSKHSSDSEVKTVVRSRDSSPSEERNVIDNVPKESKLTKSGKKSKRSDINANTRTRSRTSDSERTDDNSDIGNEDEQLDEDYTDSGLISPSHSNKVSKTRPSSMSNRNNSSNINSSSNISNTPNIDSTPNISDSELTDASEKGEKRQRLSSSGNSEIDQEDEVILKREFEKLRTFAREVVPRPLYEEVKFEEEIEPEPIEDSMECVTVDHEESQEEFSTRFFTYDKVHDADNRALPDFSDLDYEYHDIGFNEVDPDLLSMNLAPIMEETEEELAEEEEEEAEDGSDEQDWRGNWMFKGIELLYSVELT